MQVLQNKKLTYKDIKNLPEGNYEIIDGEIVEIAPVGFEIGYYEGNIAYFLEKYLKNKGYVAVGEVGVLISKNPLRIRGADIVYVSKEKIKEKPKGILEIAPDLIIEIISPNNTVSEIEEKVEDYLKIGVQKVMLINPQTQKVFIYEKGKREIKMFNFNEEIDFVEGLKGKIIDIVKD